MDTFTPRLIKYLIFYSNAKEKRKYNASVYRVPNLGDLAHPGFGGIEAMSADIAIRNNAEHPLVRNIIEGDYLLDYFVNRVSRRAAKARKFLEWYQGMVDLIKSLPSYLKPLYVLETTLHVCKMLRTRYAQPFAERAI